MIGRIRRFDLGVNCYLVEVENGYVLIDTGFPSKRDRLEAELAAAGCGPDELRLIILTHGDVDHAGNCARIFETPSAHPLRSTVKMLRWCVVETWEPAGRTSPTDTPSHSGS